jgi:hypothetical protein
LTARSEPYNQGGLHAKSVTDGAQGVIYSLLGSCRRLGVNPFDYLKDLLTRLLSALRVGQGQSEG